MSSQKVIVQKFEADIIEKVQDYLNQYFAHQVRVLGTRIGLWRYGALRKALPVTQPDKESKTPLLITERKKSTIVPYTIVPCGFQILVVLY